MDIKLDQIKATIQDARDIYEWRNDSLTRQMSLSSGELVWEEHLNWFENSLLNENRKIFIFKIDGEKVGMGRVDTDETHSVLSWMISPLARGRGIGKALVKKLTISVDGPKKAIIKKSNITSIKIAEFAGFIETSRENDILTFEIK